MAKLIWFDGETTGLDPIQNGLVQLAIMIEIDGEVVAERAWNITTFKKDVIDDGALEVTGFTRKEILGWQDPVEVHEEVVRMWGAYIDKFDKKDKAFPAGHNVRFDIDFLASWFKKCNDKYIGSWWNWYAIDTLQYLNILKLAGALDLPNHKLETACEHFKIEIKAHDALSDVRATRELYKILKEMVVVVT